MSAAGVRAVVFDLGGVLLRLADPLEIFELELTEAEFHARWLASRSVREFERGAIDARAFAASVVRELGLPMDPERFLERFDAWPQGLFPETHALLDAVPAGVRRVLLSNTNAAHWGRPGVSGELAGRFDFTFVSYHTGLLKPDAEAFEQVVAACACTPGELLFFDDNPGNVDAALCLGLRAHLVKGPREALRVLQAVVPGAALPAEPQPA
jgi:putative hydrolase of the HAD superfamily